MAYVIVEKSGYVGETDGPDFKDYWAALNAMQAQYTPDEIDALHVRIAYDGPEGRTYEV
ncbi:MAG: hypothetical protein HQL38_07925 [Alphaproteobacteria bacterium]|nr:hypothetical protein [Alphaproteobacteria bacterium]